MSTADAYSSDVAFTPSVKAVQTRKGSRTAYAAVEERGAWRTRITPELAQVVEAQTSIFLATLNGEGQPYIQHRGGPAGFLRVLDDKTIGFADFAGNRQYITQGNLADNPKAHLFLIDYAHRKRVKIWGEARVVEGDGELIGRVLDNLIGNALKYTERGGHIWLTAVPHNDSLTVQVRDDGEGIAPTATAHIFDKFYQVKDDSGKPLRRGTGLGLTFCKLVVEAHHGRIWVESAPGQGSAFFFSLPLNS